MRPSIGFLVCVVLKNERMRMDGMKSDAGQTVRREFSSVEQVTKIEKLVGKWEQIFYSKIEKLLARKIASNTIDALGPFDSFFVGSQIQLGTYLKKSKSPLSLHSSIFQDELRQTSKVGRHIHVGEN